MSELRKILERLIYFEGSQKTTDELLDQAVSDIRKLIPSEFEFDRLLQQNSEWWMEGDMKTIQCDGKGGFPHIAQKIHELMMEKMG